MAVNTKLKNTLTIIEKIYIPVLVMILIIAIFLFCFSLYKICVIEEIINSYTIEGFNNFLQIFRFPIAMLGAVVITITLLNSAIRHLWLNEQLSLNRHHINMNNYYKHMEEFTNMIFDLKESVEKGNERYLKTLSFLMKSITKHDCRKLYFHWYGKKFDSKSNVKKEIKEFIEKYYRTILACNNEEELSNARFREMTMITDLNFSELNEKILSREIDYYDYSFVFLIENILDFSDDIILGEVYNSLGKDVEKKLDKIVNKVNH